MILQNTWNYVIRKGTRQEKGNVVAITRGAMSYILFVIITLVTDMIIYLKV